jgi:hypothetical protein
MHTASEFSEKNKPADITLAIADLLLQQYLS